MVAATIYEDLAGAIRAGKISIEQATDLDEEDIEEIREAASKLPNRSEGAVKELYTNLGGTWSFGILRCVLAGI